MGWYPAPSVAAALAQATALWPSRDRRSDGTIGDAAHQAHPTSDHNPDNRGMVHAFDLTHGPFYGNGHPDCGPLSAHLIATRDHRVKYLIFQRRICSGAGGPAPWVWRAYDGSSAHLEHLHVSINYTASSENDTSPWWAVPDPMADGVLEQGESGPAIAAIQRLLHITADGDYGPATAAAVEAFQRAHGLVADGKAGRLTYAALLSANSPTFPLDLEEETTVYQRYSNPKKGEFVVSISGGVHILNPVHLKYLIAEGRLSTTVKPLSDTETAQLFEVER